MNWQLLLIDPHSVARTGRPKSIITAFSSLFYLFTFARHLTGAALPPLALTQLRLQTRHCLGDQIILEHMILDHDFRNMLVHDLRHLSSEWIIDSDNLAPWLQDCHQVGRQKPAKVTILRRCTLRYRYRSTGVRHNPEPILQMPSEQQRD